MNQSATGTGCCSAKNKPVITIDRDCLSSPYRFIARVRQQMVLAGMYSEAKLYDSYAMDVNPIHEALKYVEVVVK